jgi:acyl-CoA synthetase (AMP-forming)/AMP-acid ligase II
VELLPEPGVSPGGRVFVRGGGLAFGYADGAADAMSAFEHGGFRTGDLGRFDGDGRLVLTGRVSAHINVAGRKVDPSEVERVLTALPAVNDARVIGIACATRGQELVAFVVPAAAAPTALELRRSCAERLSPYKIPRRFIVLDAWPVDGRGKIDRRALEARATSA